VPRTVLALLGLVTLLASAFAPATARADADCARVRPDAARAACEEVLRAIRADDGAALARLVAPRGIQRIDRYLPRGQGRNLRLGRDELRAAIGASARAFLRLGAPADDTVRVVHHLAGRGSDVPSFVRIEIVDVDTDTIASLALGGDGWTIDLVIIRPRHFRD
jgi:hypothetical protein